MVRNTFTVTTDTLRLTPTDADLRRRNLAVKMTLQANDSGVESLGSALLIGV